jgi:hypothetical protein
VLSLHGACGHLTNNEEAAEHKILLDKIRSTLRMQSRSVEMKSFALLKIDAMFFVGFDFHF